MVFEGAADCCCAGDGTLPGGCRDCGTRPGDSDQRSPYICGGNAGDGCSLVWHSNETSPTVVPKLSLSSGLVYLYTKDADPVYNRDSWYLTAVDFHSGATRWKQLAGNGLFYNNNYAPITIGRDRRLYVGTLGGLVQLSDQP